MEAKQEWKVPLNIETFEDLSGGGWEWKMPLKAHSPPLGRNVLITIFGDKKMKARISGEGSLSTLGRV